MLVSLIACVAAFEPAFEPVPRPNSFDPVPRYGPRVSPFPHAAPAPSAYVVAVRPAATRPPVLSCSALAQCVCMFATVGIVARALAPPRAPPLRLQDGQKTIKVDGKVQHVPDSGEAYSEVSRPYRRSVFFHENWITHRSSNRYLKEMQGFFDSGVIRSLSREITFVTMCATFVVAINMLISGYDDFSMVHHDAPLPMPLIGKELSLPALPFTIAMPALSLLLVFRTNTAYSRWNEARTIWGGIVNTCRNLQRQSNVYFAKEDTALREELTREAALFPKALRSFLRGATDDPVFREDATRLAGADTAEALMVSKNRATFVCNMLSTTIQRANLNPMDRARMDDMVCKLVDYLGACERIFRSPVPLVYTRHTARFLTSLMVLLPLALWPAMGGSWNHWATIPATAILAVFLFGIEELGIQIEEPFGILPLESLCDTSIETVVMDMQDSYKQGHFGELRVDDRELRHGPPTEWVSGTVVPAAASLEHDHPSSGANSPLTSYREVGNY